MAAQPLYIILLASIVITILVSFFVVSIVRQHRRFVRIQQGRMRNEISLLEKERKRMAHDLHDDMGPQLSAVKMQLACLESVAENEQYLLHKASRSIDQIIDTMRAVSFNLLPSSFQRKGLVPALRELMASKISVCNMEMVLEADEAIPLANDQQLHLYRIAQELLHNSIKHSGANKFRILLKVEKNTVIFLLEDDGKGFNRNKTMQTASGLGLKSIESRAQILGAQMLTESAPGRGCCYYFEIPIRIQQASTEMDGVG